MKKNIFEKEYSSVAISIFKDESVFYPNYLPEEIKSRDKETQDISYNLRPIVEVRKSRNTLLFGPPGTGKTLISKYVLKQLSEFTQRAKSIYINAIEDNTRFALYCKLLSLYNSPLPRRGLGIDEILNRIKEEMAKTDFIPIVIIDEVDKLEKSEISTILYDLSRIEVNNKYFALILITNYKEFIITLDPRVQSSLFLSEVEFKKYSPQELKEILRERIEYGLIPKAISEDLIGYITGYAAKNGGDARIAIDLLFKSAKTAEKKGFQRIDKEIIIDSAKFIDAVKLSEKLNYIEDIEKKILQAIPEGGIESGKLYTKFKADSERTIRRYLENLENIGLIKTKEDNSQKGRTRIIELCFNKELLK
ncbi:MAG: AAA family ATPase [archaeon]|jgi:cell division control protein 6